MLRHLRLLTIAVALVAAGIASQASPIPAAAAPMGDYATGCTGQYYNNTNLSGSPVLVRSDAAINFFWPEFTSPAPGVNISQYSVRWTCTINVPTSGSYTWTMVADDGMNLLVDNNLLIWAFYDQGPTTYNASLYMNSGTHTVVVEYYNNTNGGTAQVYNNISGTNVYYQPNQGYYPPGQYPPGQQYYNQPPGYYYQTQPYYNQPPQLVITADNLNIAPGQCTVIRWAVAYVTSFNVNGIGSITNPGAWQVCPNTTTNYTLQVTSAFGNYSRTVTVRTNGYYQQPGYYYPPGYQNPGYQYQYHP
jgi:hypothetical protein